MAGTRTRATPPERLWDGDVGTLSLPVRDVLVRLVREPCLFASDDAARWQCLKRNQDVVASRLADLGQELVVNDEFGVALASQAQVDGLASLVTVRPLRLSTTWLLCDCVRQMGVWEAQGGSPEAMRIDFEDELARARESGSVLGDVSTDKAARGALAGAFRRLRELGYVVRVGRVPEEWAMTGLWRATITPERVEGWLAELASAAGGGREGVDG